jgi:hypothetical protein
MAGLEVAAEAGDTNPRTVHRSGPRERLQQGRQLVDAGDVNADKIHDLDIVWRLADRVGAFTGWRRVFLFGSRRLSWRNVETALKAGGAKKYPINTGLPAERYGLASATGAYMGTGQAQTASTRDDRVEAHFAWTDSPGCSNFYTASRLIITNLSGKVVFTYGEDWGDNQAVYNLDRPRHRPHCQNQSPTTIL